MFDDDSSSEEDERQAFYAGGSQQSGQQVLGPSKKKKDIVSQLFKSARELVFVLFYFRYYLKSEFIISLIYFL